MPVPLDPRVQLALGLSVSVPDTEPDVWLDPSGCHGSIDFPGESSNFGCSPPKECRSLGTPDLLVFFRSTTDYSSEGGVTTATVTIVTNWYQVVRGTRTLFLTTYLTGRASFPDGDLANFIASLSSWPSSLVFDRPRFTFRRNAFTGMQFDKCGSIVNPEPPPGIPTVDDVKSLAQFLTTNAGGGFLPSGVSFPVIINCDSCGELTAPTCEPGVDPIEVLVEVLIFGLVFTLAKMPVRLPYIIKVKDIPLQVLDIAEWFISQSLDSIVIPILNSSGWQNYQNFQLLQTTGDGYSSVILGSFDSVLSVDYDPETGDEIITQENNVPISFSMTVIGNCDEPDPPGEPLVDAGGGRKMRPTENCCGGMGPGVVNYYDFVSGHFSPQDNFVKIVRPNGTIYYSDGPFPPYYGQIESDHNWAGYGGGCDGTISPKLETRNITRDPIDFSAPLTEDSTYVETIKDTYHTICRIGYTGIPGCADYGGSSYWYRTRSYGPYDYSGLKLKPEYATAGWSLTSSGGGSGRSWQSVIGYNCNGVIVYDSFSESPELPFEPPEAPSPPPPPTTVPCFQYTVEVNLKLGLAPAILRRAKANMLDDRRLTPKFTDPLRDRDLFIDQSKDLLFKRVLNATGAFDLTLATWRYPVLCTWYEAGDLEIWLTNLLISFIPTGIGPVSLEFNIEKTGDCECTPP